MTTCIEAGHGKANTSDKNKHLSAIHECFEGVFNAVQAVIHSVWKGRL